MLLAMYKSFIRCDVLIWGDIEIGVSAIPLFLLLVVDIDSSKLALLSFDGAHWSPFSSRVVILLI